MNTDNTNRGRRAVSCIRWFSRGADWTAGRPQRNAYYCP
jgi:hypothetical protein